MAFNTATARKAGKKSKRSQDAQLKEIREIFNNLLSDNRQKIQIWLDEVAKDDPAKALELLLKMSSFVIPKPRTVELSGSIDQTTLNLKILNIDPLSD